MSSSQKYTAAEIKELVNAFRTDPELSPEKIAGMDMLVEVLDRFGNMTEAEMSEYGRSAFRVLKKDEALKKLKK